MTQLGALQYDGEIRLVEQDPMGVTFSNRKLSIANARPEWASADALVTRTRIDLDNGVTAITLGVAGHLGPRDLIQTLRVNRRRRRRGSSIRTGVSGTSIYPTIGHKLPTQNALTENPEPLASVIDAGQGGGKLQVSGYWLPTDLPRDLYVFWREIIVCQAGGEHRMLVLASEDFTRD